MSKPWFPTGTIESLVPTLRHAPAVHLLAAGVDLRII